MRIFIFVFILFPCFIIISQDSNQLSETDKIDQDREACEFARKEEKKEVWQRYLKKFPKGICVFEAEVKIDGYIEIEGSVDNRNEKDIKQQEENIEIICNDGRGCFESGEKIRNLKKMFTEESLELFRKSCDLQYGDGCYRVGEYLLKTNSQESFNLFEKACFFNSQEGCYQKAKAILNKDADQAEKIFADTCKMNLAKGCVAQGILIYKNGASEQSNKLFEKACEMNDGRGCFLQGRNENDIYKKKDLFWKSCESGDIYGCYEKAKFLATGIAGEKDKKKAAEIVEKINEEDEKFTISLKPYLGMKMTPEEINKYAENSVALILTDKGLGSGFVLNEKNYIVTNFHVMEGAIKGTVRFKNKKEDYNIIRVIFEDEQNDIAIIAIDAPAGSLQPLKITEKLPAIGENLVAIGNPKGMTWSLTTKDRKSVV